MKSRQYGSVPLKNKQRQQTSQSRVTSKQSNHRLNSQERIIGSQMRINMPSFLPVSELLQPAYIKLKDLAIAREKIKRDLTMQIQ